MTLVSKLWGIPDKQNSSNTPKSCDEKNSIAQKHRSEIKINKKNKQTGVTVGNRADCYSNKNLWQIFELPIIPDDWEVLCVWIWTAGVIVNGPFTVVGFSILIWCQFESESQIEIILVKVQML